MPRDTPSPRVLRLPPASWRPVLRFRDRDDQLLLTDRLRRHRFWQVPALAILAGLLALAVRTWFVAADPVAALLVDGVALGIPALGLTAAAFLKTGTHHSFTVRVDRNERTCVCHRWAWGFRTGRAELRWTDADWTIEAFTYREAEIKDQTTSVIGTLVSLLLGPLGLLMVLASSSRSRRANTHRAAPPQDGVRLSLRDPQGLRVTVTTGDEQAAGDFLAAWDRLTAGR